MKNVNKKKKKMPTCICGTIICVIYFVTCSGEINRLCLPEEKRVNKPWYSVYTEHVR